MKVLDLFSGIGGFSLGLERAGFETVAFCEYDEKCRKVLTKHWPKVPQYNDVRTLTAEQLENDGVTGIEVICGGFPCQDVSFAGLGAGLDGERSGLWSEYKRLISEIRPRIALIENVSALLVRGLDRVLCDLASLGYDAEWHCVPASSVGANHRRDRVWIIAHLGAADAYSEGLQRRQSPKVQKRHIAEGYSRSGSWWQTESKVPRVDDGIPRSMDRIKQLGNSVVPQVVEVMGRAIMESEA